MNLVSERQLRQNLQGLVRHFNFVEELFLRLGSAAVISVIGEGWRQLIDVLLQVTVAIVVLSAELA